MDRAIVQVGTSQITHQAAQVRKAQVMTYAIARSIQDSLKRIFGKDEYGNPTPYPVVSGAFVRGRFTVVELDPLSVMPKGLAHKVIDPMMLGELGNSIRRPVWGTLTFPRHNATPSSGLWLVTSWIEPQDDRNKLAPSSAMSGAPSSLSVTLNLDERILLEQRELSVPIGFGCEINPVGARMGDERDLLTPLRRMIHVMVIGETGAGKTNWIKAALVALTKQASPDEIKFAFISPKESEFVDLARSAYSWSSAKWDRRKVATDADEADRLVTELHNEFRYRDSVLFVESGVTSIDEYNRANPGRQLPRLILVVDEIINLIGYMPPGSKFKEHLSGITSIGRSAGIHVFAGTTNMNYQVLPTNWSKNVPNTIMCRVHDKATADHFQCYGAQDIGDGDEDRGIFVARVNGKLWHGKAYLAGKSAVGIQEDDHEAPAASVPRLSAAEAEIVIYAHERNNGLFVVGTLYRAFGPRWSHTAIDILARRLERDGLLTPGRGNKGRAVTDDLVTLAVSARSGSSVTVKTAN